MAQTNSSHRETQIKKDPPGTKRSEMLGSKSDPGYISPDEEPAPSKELRGTKTVPGKPSPTNRNEPTILGDEEDSVSQ